MGALSNISNAIDKFECNTGIKPKYIYMNGLTILKLEEEIKDVLVFRSKQAYCKIFDCIVVIDNSLKGDECYLSAKRIE